VSAVKALADPFSNPASAKPFAADHPCPNGLPRAIASICARNVLMSPVRLAQLQPVFSAKALEPGCTLFFPLVSWTSFVCRNFTGADRSLVVGPIRGTRQPMGGEWIEDRFEIIGEATKPVSKDLRATYPEVPWQDIAGMRGKFESWLLWRVN
jgi:hypothetical protein